MHAKSKAQQKAAGAALAAKRGEQKKSDLVGASKDMYESMTEDELEELKSSHLAIVNFHLDLVLSCQNAYTQFLQWCYERLKTRFR